MYRTHVDFRKSIKGLTLTVEQELGLDPFNTSLHLFSNRMRENVAIRLKSVTCGCIAPEPTHQALPVRTKTSSFT
ncbi:IS66 family insertion sequence element accessory protein TnpB, partial [Marinagarivorans algicola]|uniref:IS66 family insertion sequence element accessory protein TnpB n=1 Tax=Marinagarivorans algicola TaxID=1513270 RepID=UPI0037351B4B